MTTQRRIRQRLRVGKTSNARMGVRALPTTLSPKEKNAELRRPANSTIRPREYLTPDEMHRVLQAAKKSGGRYAPRNFTLLLICYRHGLRAGEASGLLWSQVELKRERLHVRRLKDGDPGVHPLRKDEVKALRQLRRDCPENKHVFIGERGNRLSVSGIRQIVQGAGEAAGLEFPIHAHVLRHSCGYALADQGWDLLRIKDWLGHVCVSSSALYVQLSPHKFDGVWRD